ncbi:hypothetical protein [Streptomyces sp. SAI-129]|uniref:hypothetical protein n=1 Tax=Streptomyces sp. SAI-129 TaxID=3377727 RepID=UPI003C7C4F3E
MSLGRTRVTREGAVGSLVVSLTSGGVACVAAVGLLTAALPDARTDEDALRRAREGNGPRTEEPTPT